MTRPTLPRSRTVAVAVLVPVALVQLGACSQDDTPVGTTPKGASTASGILPADAYRASLVVLVQASNPPNPQDARLSTAYSGAALANARTTVGRFANDGIGVRGSYDVADVRVVDSGATSATLEACTVDRTEQFRLVDGRVVRPASGARNSITVRMVLSAGGWTVDELLPGPGC